MTTSLSSLLLVAFLVVAAQAFTCPNCDSGENAGNPWKLPYPEWDDLPAYYKHGHGIITNSPDELEILILGGFDTTLLAQGDTSLNPVLNMQVLTMDVDATTSTGNVPHNITDPEYDYPFYDFSLISFVDAASGKNLQAGFGGVLYDDSLESPTVLRTRSPFIVDATTSTVTVTPLGLKENVPSGAMRYRHAACWSQHWADNGRMVVFGGIAGNNEAEGLFTFDLATGAWEELIPLSTLVPPTRYDTSMGCVGESVYVFGGRSGSSCTTTPSNCVTYNDFWKFNITSLLWEHISAGGDPPSERDDHELIVLNDDTIIISGGTERDLKILYDDVHAYSITDNTWDLLCVPGTPVPRYAHTSSRLDDESFLVYGGFGIDPNCILSDGQIDPTCSNPNIFLSHPRVFDASVERDEVYCAYQCNNAGTSSCCQMRDTCTGLEVAALTALECSGARPFACLTDDRQLVCESSLSACENGGGTCRDVDFQCWNGQCVSAQFLCPPVPSCGPGGYRCEDGTCDGGCAFVAPDTCLDAGEFGCVNGGCASDCSPFTGCPAGFNECPDGRCVEGVSACTDGFQVNFPASPCGFGSYPCPDGSCTSILTGCSTQPTWRLSNPYTAITLMGDRNNDYIIQATPSDSEVSPRAILRAITPGGTTEDRFHVTVYPTPPWSELAKFKPMTSWVDRPLSVNGRGGFENNVFSPVLHFSVESTLDFSSLHAYLLDVSQTSLKGEIQQHGCLGYVTASKEWACLSDFEELHLNTPPADMFGGAIGAALLDHGQDRMEAYVAIIRETWPYSTIDRILQFFAIEPMSFWTPYFSVPVTSVVREDVGSAVTLHTDDAVTLSSLEGPMQTLMSELGILEGRYLLTQIQDDVNGGYNTTIDLAPTNVPTPSPSPGSSPTPSSPTTATPTPTPSPTTSPTTSTNPLPPTNGNTSGGGEEGDDPTILIISIIIACLIVLVIIGGIIYYTRGSCKKKPKKETSMRTAPERGFNPSNRSHHPSSGSRQDRRGYDATSVGYNSHQRNASYGQEEDPRDRVMGPASNIYGNPTPPPPANTANNVQVPVSAAPLPPGQGFYLDPNGGVGDGNGGGGGGGGDDGGFFLDPLLATGEGNAAPNIGAPQAAPPPPQPTPQPQQAPPPPPQEARFDASRLSLNPATGLPPQSPAAPPPPPQNTATPDATAPPPNGGFMLTLDMLPDDLQQF